LRRHGKKVREGAQERMSKHVERAQISQKENRAIEWKGGLVNHFNPKKSIGGDLGKNLKEKIRERKGSSRRGAYELHEKE